jgi:hypothetical protein
MNLSIKHKFINVNFAKRFQVFAKHIHRTQGYGKNVHFFQDLDIIMDNYAMHSYFQAIDIDYVDIILGYSGMDSVQLILKCKRSS